MGRNPHRITDALGGLQFNIMTLTIIKTQRVTGKALIHGDGKGRRRIKSA